MTAVGRNDFLIFRCRAFDRVVNISNLGVPLSPQTDFAKSLLRCTLLPYTRYKGTDIYVARVSTSDEVDLKITTHFSICEGTAHHAPGMKCQNVSLLYLVG
jgi:hypothetical protein